MVDATLKTKIRSLLKHDLFSGPDDLVDVSDGPAEDIHVVVVSRKFDNRHFRERHDVIWDHLVKNLSPVEWGQVSLSIGASPEDVKAF